MFSQSSIYQWHWEIYQELPMVYHWFLLAMICGDLHQTFFHGTPILLFWEELFKAKVSSIGQRLQILAFFFLCKAGQGHFWLLFNKVGEKMPKIPKYGSKKFTFLFYFFFWVKHFKTKISSTGQTGFNNWCTSHTYVCLLFLVYTWFWPCVHWHARYFFPCDFSKF